VFVNRKANRVEAASERAIHPGGRLVQETANESLIRAAAFFIDMLH
jgi:hypothetical protein